MKRNWKDIIERALTTFVMTFVGVWAGFEFKWDIVTIKAAAIATVISIAKNLALQGKTTQTPVAELKVEDRIDPNLKAA